MKAPVRKALGLALFAGLLLPALPLTGCMSLEDGDGSSLDIDPFPRPHGPLMIPLDTSFRAGFHFTELDREGRVVQRIPELSLYVTRRTGTTFGYAFENPARGLLIRYLESVNRDSSGIWIVGSYRDGQEFTDSTPVRWLPQFPEVGKTWEVGAGRIMELVAPDAEYLTDVILRDDTTAAPIVQGMQRHSAYRFKETAGDTISYYFFRKGVGLLGYERSAGGKLIAAGSIRSFRPIGNP